MKDKLHCCLINKNEKKETKSTQRPQLLTSWCFNQISELRRAIVERFLFYSISIWERKTNILHFVDRKTVLHSALIWANVRGFGFLQIFAEFGCVYVFNLCCTSSRNFGASPPLFQNKQQRDDDTSCPTGHQTLSYVIINIIISTTPYSFWIASKFVI